MENNSLKSQFLLKPGITFLNFGSFGSCPKPIFEDYQKWQLELEAEPVQFITITGLANLKKSREALATYINCSADDLVFMPNPSHAINLIAKSFPLQPCTECCHFHQATSLHSFVLRVLKWRGMNLATAK